MIRIRSKTDADDGLDMTPLIDCVFNLLLFFVLAASFTNLVKTFRSRPGQLVLMAAPKAPVEALVYLVDQVRRQGGEKLMVATSIPKEE